MLLNRSEKSGKIEKTKYYAGMFDEKRKAEQRGKQFPIDLNRAYEMDKRIVEKQRGLIGSFYEKMGYGGI